LKQDHATAGFSLFILITVLVACNGQIEETPQARELPTQSSTPQVQPTASSTFTPLPPRAATRYAGMLTYIPIMTARAQNKINDCNGSPDGFGMYDQFVSPSGSWHITYCKYPDSGADYTKVINSNKNIAWEVPYLDSEGQNRPEGSTGGQMLFEAWSDDEQFAYFERYYCCLDGPGIEFSPGFGLYQLELSSGKIAKIESGSLSPDGYSLIFHDDNNYQVIVKNLKNGQTTPFRIDKDFERAGIFQWSPDGSKIVFSAADENWFKMEASFTMYLVDINKTTIRKMLYDPLRRYIALKWLSEKEILLEGYRSADDYIFSIETNELTPIDSEALTLTPFP
jgi:hypothetical protein